LQDNLIGFTIKQLLIWWYIVTARPEDQPLSTVHNCLFTICIYSLPGGPFLHPQSEKNDNFFFFCLKITPYKNVLNIKAVNLTDITTSYQAPNFCTTNSFWEMWYSLICTSCEKGITVKHEDHNKISSSNIQGFKNKI
jgi:hypothetical protein